MAKLSFTTNLRAAALTKAGLANFARFDWGASTVLVGVDLQTGGGSKFTTTWNLLIGNVTSEAIQADATNTTGMTIATIPTPGAYSAILAAFKGSGSGVEEAAILQIMTNAGILPPGTVV